MSAPARSQDKRPCEALRRAGGSLGGARPRYFGVSFMVAPVFSSSSYLTQ
jgi:hypothetical protein